LVGLDRLFEQNISDSIYPNNETGRGSRYNNSIAIGEFNIDIHAEKINETKGNSDNRGGTGQSTVPYQIPIGVIIPQTVDGLLAAEKSISVSHVANGATRVQHPVMLVGQAAGALAALAAKKGIEPRQVDYRELQKILLSQDPPEMLFYFSDLPPTHPRFNPIQVLALDGVAQGYGPPDYTFKPDQNVTRLEAGLFVRRALELDTSWWWNYSNTSRWVVNVTDINDTDNYSKAYYLPFWKDVQALYANNITKGCEMVNETTTPVKIKYCPNRTIWRSEIIVFVTRSRKLVDYNKTTPTFNDVPITYWAYKEIEAAYADYIIDFENGYLRPSDDATRADVVYWIYKGLKRFNTAPTHRRVNITSANNLTCITDSLNDVDNDNISVMYKWSRNNLGRAKLLMPFDVDEKDYSDSNNNVIINGPVAFRRRGELQGGRMDFNGINTSINVSDSSYLDLPKNLTVEAWILKKSHGNWSGIVTKAEPWWQYGYNYNLRESNNTNGAIDFRVGNSTVIFNVTSTAPLELNQWYHVAGVRSGTTLALYINGKLNMSVIISNSDLATGDRPVIIGAVFNSTAHGFPRFFNGSIDEVRIYDYALSQAQIEMHSKRLYNMTAKQETRNNEIWKCEVTPNDGYHNGAALNSSTVTITNGFSGSGFGGEGSFGAGNEGGYGTIVE
ncbi:MAG: FAD-dependent oxidoreductase, partial [Candidatus Omnitrophica bacterium]|nr:FAD-dependent oxidoreductase [Candidatus Omnitrophota bacterium]